MKVALYARVSTRDKEQNPEVQLANLRKYCEREGLEIVKEYVDKASAVDFPGRKAWTQLMKDASLRKFDKILVWRLDRAFRDVGHSVASMKLMESYGVDFRSVSDLPLDLAGPFAEFLRVTRVAYAALERASTIEKINDGMRHAKEHGTKSGKPIGRKRKGVDFTTICKAVQSSLSGDGKVQLSAAARVIKELTGESVSPAFITMRVRRKAWAMDVTEEDLVERIVAGEALTEGEE